MPGAQGPKTVKGAKSDPSYVSRLLLDCVPVFHKIITFCNTVDCRSEAALEVQRWTRARGECLPARWGGAKIIATPLGRTSCSVRVRQNNVGSLGRSPLCSVAGPPPTERRSPLPAPYISPLDRRPPPPPPPPATTESLPLHHQPPSSSAASPEQRGIFAPSRTSAPSRRSSLPPVAAWRSPK